MVPGPRSGSCPASIPLPPPRDALGHVLICPWASCCSQAWAHVHRGCWTLRHSGYSLQQPQSFLLPRLLSRPICRGLAPGLPRLCARQPELASRSACPRRQKCTLPLSPNLGVEAHLCFTLFIKQLWSSGSRSGDRPHLSVLRPSANLRATSGPGHWASLSQTLLVYLPGTCTPAACPKAASSIRFRTHRWV